MKSQTNCSSNRASNMRRSKKTIRCRRAKTLKVIESEGEQSDTLSELCLQAGFNMYELGPPQLISTEFQDLLNDLQKKNDEKAGEDKNSNDAEDSDDKAEQLQQSVQKSLEK